MLGTMRIAADETTYCPVFRVSATPVQSPATTYLKISTTASEDQQDALVKKGPGAPLRPILRYVLPAPPFRLCGYTRERNSFALQKRK